MTAPTESTGLAVNASGLPDLNKPAVAIKFADMWSQGKLDKLTSEQQGIFLAALGQHMGIKAELGDLMIYQGKPYITISGYRRIAHQSGLLAGIAPRPAGERDFRIYKAAAEDHLWVCEVWKKGCGRPFTGWGHVRTGSDRNPVTKSHPQEMAKKRAIYDALRLAFPPSEIIGELHMKYAPEAEARAAELSAVHAPEGNEDEVIDGDLEELNEQGASEPTAEYQDDSKLAQD